MNSDPIESARPAGNPSRSAWFGLVLIVVLAGAMRFVGLETHPNGLFRDEAEKGYNAWALQQSGGVIEFRAQTPGGPVGPVFRRPLMFVNVMGSQTPALYHWMAVPFIKVFGLSPRATRMPAALAGTISVALVGMICMLAFGSQIGLLAAVWLALCPWHYIFSRWAQQGILVTVGLGLVLLGVHGLTARRRWAFPLIGFAFGFCFYAYTGAQPFVLAYGAAIIGLHHKIIRTDWKRFLAGIFLAAIWIVPTVVAALGPGEETRLGRVAVWNAPDATIPLTLLRIPGNWLAHFNPWYLFVSGDSFPRHGLPGLGQLLLVDAIFLPLGVVAAYRRKLPLRRELLLMLLAAPAGAAITWGHIPHALRSLPMLIPCVIFSAIGIAALNGFIASRAGMHPSSKILRITLLAACLIFAGRIFGLYWGMSATDPRYLHLEDGFSQGYAQGFAEMAEYHSAHPDSRLFVHAAIPYAPYYSYFYLRVIPEIAASGIDKSGFVLFDPIGRTAPRLAGQIRPSDGVISFDPQGTVRFSISPNSR